MLKVEHLFFTFEERPLLQNISFQLKEGEIATLLGCSGAGKTTLFKLITGLIPLQKGLIEIAGQTGNHSYQKVSYMMQEDLLLPWRTVMSNMMLAFELGDTSKFKNTHFAEAAILLEEIGLKECAELFPEELSGGMRQRVSLARALLQKRPLLLLDEPFGALDVFTREQMYKLLRTIKNKYGTTILLVSHDFRDAVSLSDRIFLLKDGLLTHEWQVDDLKRNHPSYMGSLLEQLRSIITK